MKKMNQMLVVALMLVAMLFVITAPVRADATEEDARIAISLPQDDLFYGDMVTLSSEVKGVDGSYTITWEADYGQGWESVGTGRTLSFELTEQSAAAAYRAVLTVE